MPHSSRIVRLRVVTANSSRRQAAQHQHQLQLQLQQEQHQQQPQLQLQQEQHQQQPQPQPQPHPQHSPAAHMAPRPAPGSGSGSGSGPRLSMVMNPAAYDNIPAATGLFVQLRTNIDDIHVCLALRGRSDTAAAMEDFMADMLSRAIHGSNLLAAAALGVDRATTARLCRPVFRSPRQQSPPPGTGVGSGYDYDDDDDDDDWDSDWDSDNDDDDEEQLQGIDKDFAAILEPARRAAVRARREVIQHAKAAKYLFTELFLHDNPLSEDLILETHRILTRGVDTPQGTPSVDYGGVYRQRHHPRHHLRPMMSHALVPFAMRSLLAALDRDLAGAAAAGCLDPIALAAKYSRFFLDIHSFLDANGRIARLILNALLIKHAGLVVCIGDDPDSGDLYAQAATPPPAFPSVEQLADGKLKPRDYGILASLTLRHARDTTSQLASVLSS